MARLKIAFMGLPLAALLLAGDGHDLVYAAICRRGAIGMRRLRRTLGARRVFIKPDLRAHAERIRALAPDLVVSWFWTSRIPAEVRAAARLAAFGVHPSLLPRHRGGDPYFAAIDAGDAETGVTAHLLEEDYDTGDLLGARRLAIDPSWSAWRLAKRLDRPSLALLRETAKAFAEGRPPTRAPQDARLATSAGLPTEEDLELDFSRSAVSLERRIRAASPYPGAYFHMGDALVTVVRAAPTSELPEGLRVGEIAVDRHGTAVVRAGDGGLALLVARLAGEGGDEATLDRAQIADLVRSLAKSTTEDGSLGGAPYVD